MHGPAGDGAEGRTTWGSRGSVLNPEQVFNSLQIEASVVDLVAGLLEISSKSLSQGQLEASVDVLERACQTASKVADQVWGARLTAIAHSHLGCALRRYSISLITSSGLSFLDDSSRGRCFQEAEAAFRAALKASQLVCSQKNIFTRAGPEPPCRRDGVPQLGNPQTFNRIVAPFILSLTPQFH
jgi:hypothetical protein